MSKQTDLINIPDAITVDGSNVGIGTSSPSATLTASQSSNNIFALERTGISGSSGQFGINIESNSQTTVSYDDGAQLVFGTASSPSTHVGFTERMRLDSSGRVTMPYQPAFYAYGSPNGSIATSATYASPTFNQTGHNIGGHFNTSNYRFTAPVAGRYFFHLSIYWNSTNGYSRMRIEKNGSTIDHYNMKPGTGGDHSQQVFGVVQMAVNDYVIAQAQSDQSNSYFRARNHTFFEGYLIG